RPVGGTGQRRRYRGRDADPDERGGRRLLIRYRVQHSRPEARPDRYVRQGRVQGMPEPGAVQRVGQRPPANDRPYRAAQQAHRTGLYRRPPPLLPGAEGAGVVNAVGPGVETVKVGDRVASTELHGAYAEYAVVPADRVVTIPDGVSDEQAAAVLLQGLTAHYL